MKEAVIGIDIGGTFTKYGVLDREGNCLVESFTSTATHDDFDDYLKELLQAIESPCLF